MKVLFIGGTGVISSACADMASKNGLDLYLLNRGLTARPLPSGVKQIKADVRNPGEVRQALAGQQFDVVVNWIAFEPEHVSMDIEIFQGQIGQYIFISSASVYATPKSYPVTEGHPIFNPYWVYSQKKIACEEVLNKALADGFPVTIVRPSHTYDRTMLPITGRYTVVDRMKKGLPVIIHGDGTSLWTLTHHSDFARGFVPLLGLEKAIGEVFHITSDEWLSWNQIFEMIAVAFGTKVNPIHIPSDFINQIDPEWGAGLLGDKSVSMIFDNTKIKSVVPDYAAEISFEQGVKEIAHWFNEDSGRQTIDSKMNQTMDQIIKEFHGS